MKKDIHPKYYKKTIVECACGNRFEVGSTKEHIQVEICSACHPFYTGKHKLVDTAGQVDKFKEKIEKADKAKTKKEIRDNQKKAKVAKKKQEEKKEETKKEQKPASSSLGGPGKK